MKKLISVIMLLSLALYGCSFGGEQAEVTPSPSPTLTPTPSPTQTPFEDVEKVDIEISDYVDETPAPTAKETDSKTAWSDEGNNDNSNVASDVSAKTPSTNKNVQTTQKPAPVATKAPATPAPTPVPTPTPVPETVTVYDADITGKVICIDAGHGLFTEARNENIAPGSDIQKAAFKEGTKGSQHIEDTVTLAVAQKIKQLLESKGAVVLMTRTDEYSTMSNIERAEYANNNGAEIVIKLHADGTLEGGTGMTMLIPGYKYITNQTMLDNSRRLGKAVLKHSVSLTGAKNRGVYTNTEMTGFNWSTVPVILFEMGFMTNPKDEAKLVDDNYQSLIAQGVYNGIMEYYK